jgi:2,3-bisphosphoglycerate-dependent phosphoglycerate mutase
MYTPTLSTIALSYRMATTPSTLRILLIRHGETHYNIAHRLQGQLDTELTPTGRQQARIVAVRLKSKANPPPTTIYSSDLQRARITAEMILNELQHEQIKLDVRLREMCLGIFQNHTAMEAKQKFPTEWKKHQNDSSFIIPSGESVDMFYDRCNEVLLEIAEAHYGNTHTICIVTHGGVIDAIGKSWCGKNDIITHCENTAVCEMIFDGDCFHIENWNDVSHLYEEDGEEQGDVEGEQVSDILRKTE